jgi:hypothetical protein
MGKKNNVNPNHYKTAGRDRPGDNLRQDRHRQDFTRGRAERRQAVFVPIDDVPQERETDVDDAKDSPRSEDSTS